MSARLLHIYGPVWITSYGLFMALGLAVFLLSAYFHSSRRHLISDDHFFDAAATGVLGGLLGGKVLYLLQEGSLASFSLTHFIEMMLGGFAILGAIIGALLSVVLYLWWQNIAVLPTLDIAGVYAPLAHAIARWGCFFAGCCHGMATTTTGAFTVIYTDLASLAPLHVPLYATQIMMSIGSFCIFLVIRYGVYPRKRRPAGALVIWYIMLESINRFIVDFWRGDRVFVDDQKMFTPMQRVWWQEWSAYQQMAVLIITVCIIALSALYALQRRKRSG